jgi:hypothetical protein
MIKKLALVSAVAAALLATAPAAEAAQATRAPAPSGGAPLVPFLNGVLGALEVGHPATSLQSILPAGTVGR